MDKSKDNPFLITNFKEKSFYDELISSLDGCINFYFSVAFINFSGLQLLLDKLSELNQRGVKGKVITTTYLNFTEPKSLEKLLEFNNIETRIFVAKSHQGFHTKGYIFEYEDYYKVIIGSSNITQSALRTNVEWNVRIFSKKDDSFILDIIYEFNTLWDNINTHEITINFIEEYKKFLNELNVYIRKEKDAFEYHTRIEPNKMQIEAMKSLQRLRSIGESKALVIAATGTGKTYLSAFDVKQFNPKRVLFVVHREKILDDAIKTFKRVLSKAKIGKITGDKKETDKDFIFASVNSIYKDDILHSYPKDYFDYIIIDEAHRAAAMMYTKILDYFEPRFLLGMTATPERLDDHSIYEIFDNNIALEIRLRQALESDLVVPFHYFGITDVTTDLSDINITEIDKVAQRLNIKERVDFIIEKMNFYGHDGNKRKCLGFCVSKEHVRYMTEEFNKRGYTSIGLIGSEASEKERESAIERLEDNKDPLEFIFTVDIFNEGIDIPSVNLVLMLRPTQSPIIFTQQLGRGLRKHYEKEFLTVLDFIGNHNKTFLIPIALSGSNYYNQDSLKVLVDSDFKVIPGPTYIQLDRISKKRILSQLENVDFNAIPYLKEEYFEFKKLFNFKVPKLIDYLHKDMAPDPVRFINHRDTKSYVKFLSKVEKVESIKEFVKFNNLSFLEYISKMLPLRRVHEYIIIKYVILNGSASFNDIKIELKKYLDYVNEETIKHAFSYLTNDLYSVKERAKMSKFFVLEENQIRLNNFVNDLLSSEYLEYVMDTLNYGIERYLLDFKNVDYGIPFFKLYEKYTKADTLILSNLFERSPTSLREGVFKIGNNYYIYITLYKDENEVKESQMYDDKFKRRDILQWESQSTTSLRSPTGQNLINIGRNKYRLHVFVRKYKKDSYYYLGKAIVIKYENEKPIKFELKLLYPVPLELYNDFTRIVYKKNKDYVKN